MLKRLDVWPCGLRRIEVRHAAFPDESDWRRHFPNAMNACALRGSQADKTRMLVSNSNYIILSDDVLNSLLAEADHAVPMALPRKRFAALCLQAKRNADDDPSRTLMPCHEIRELMTNPLNAIAAALPIDTLQKLCRQAMSYAGPIADVPGALSRDHVLRKPAKPHRFG